MARPLSLDFHLMALDSHASNAVVDHLCDVGQIAIQAHGSWEEVAQIPVPDSYGGRNRKRITVLCHELPPPWVMVVLRARGIMVGQMPRYLQPWHRLEILEPAPCPAEVSPLNWPDYEVLDPTQDSRALPRLSSGGLDVDLHSV